jgi:hypothetical protein
MIPELIHFIWIDIPTLEMPELFKNCIISAVKNTNCKVILHTDADICISGVETRKREFDLCVKGVKYNPSEIVDQGKRVSHLKDIYRLQILLENGGIYSDCDTLWLKNPWSLLNKKCFIGYQTKSYKVLCNAIIGAEANHPAIKEYLDWIIEEFPPKKYWKIADPHKLWCKRDDVFFVESSLFFPVPYWKNKEWIKSDTGQKKIHNAIAFHLYASTSEDPTQYMDDLFRYLAL